MAEVLLVGGSGSGKWALQAALGAHHLQEANSSPAGGQAGARAPLPWRIENKYYSVDTVVRVVSTDDSSTAQTGDQIEPEALVLVFNSTQEETLTAVQDWHAKNNCESAGVRLVVATHADCLVWAEGEPARPEWLRQAMVWCAEEMFEYIECCCTDTTLDAGLSLFGDPQGLNRVVDALHAHMWPGLTKKTLTTTTRATATEIASTSKQSEDTCTQQQQAAVVLAAPQSQATSSTPVPAAPVPAQHTASANGTASKANGTSSHDRVEMDDEKVEAYERLMEEMAAAKHHLSGVDDVTRRAKAADLALRFASLLGMDSDDEEEGISSGMASEDE